MSVQISKFPRRESQNPRGGADPARSAASDMEAADEDTLDLPVTEAPASTATVDLPRARQNAEQLATTLSPLKAVGDAPGPAAQLPDPARDVERPPVEPGAPAGQPESAHAPVPTSNAVIEPAALPEAEGLPAPTPAPAKETGVGSVLRERYQLNRRLGTGGFSLIFAALDLHRKNVGSPAPTVVIKLLKPEFRSVPGSVERLKREFARLETLSHPNIGHALDLDHDGDMWFLVLEFFEGQPLSTLLERQPQRRLPRPEALKILVTSGEALDFAHRHGVLHCDFKPGNILVSPLHEVRVIDFGSGFEQVPGETTAASQPRDTRQATPAYASPEARAGAPPDVRDDVFSFAAVAYELLKGERPYGGKSTSHDPERMPLPARPEGLDSNQWQVLSQALSPFRANRPASLRPLLDAFKPRGKFDRAWLPAAVIGGLAGLLLIRYAIIGTEAPLPTDAGGRALPSAENSFLAGGESEEESLANSPVAVDGSDTAGSPGETGEVASVPASPNPAVSPPLTWVSLDQQELKISRPTAMAAMIVERNAGPARRVRIMWRTIPGTARPGVDYVPVNDGVVQLADNQNVSSLYVQLLNPDDVTGERTFYIEISSGTPQVRVGPVARVAVTVGG